MILANMFQIMVSFHNIRMKRKGVPPFNDVLDMGHSLAASCLALDSMILHFSRVRHGKNYQEKYFISRLFQKEILN